MVDEGAELTGVLVIRVWREPGYDDIRARITEVEDLSVGAETTRVVSGVAAVCHAACTWAGQWPRTSLEGRDRDSS
jgi:hypothetical protein